MTSSGVAGVRHPVTLENNPVLDHLDLGDLDGLDLLYRCWPFGGHDSGFVQLPSKQGQHTNPDMGMECCSSSFLSLFSKLKPKLGNSTRFTSPPTPLREHPHLGEHALPPCQCASLDRWYPILPLSQSKSGKCVKKRTPGRWSPGVVCWSFSAEGRDQIF